MKQQTRILVALIAIGLLAAWGGHHRNRILMMSASSALMRINRDKQTVGIRALIVQNDRTVMI